MIKFLYILMLLLTSNCFSNIHFIELDSVKTSKLNKDLIEEEFNQIYCDDSIFLNNTEQNITITYHAKNTIIVFDDYKFLSNNSDIKMKAGKSIILKPNVFISKNSHYLARIEDCEIVNCNSTNIPKGISPNGDNKNDFLDLSSLCPIEKLIIYNRYGMKLIEYSNYINQWFGQDNKNNILPTATYYYHIQFKNGNEKTGWIYLNY